MNSILKETNFIIKKYNIRANKSFGQNFLIDENVINEIVESSKIKNDELIIEIGPGLGTLTSFLLEKAKKVIAIEIDKKMINILEERFSLYNNFELICQDVLKVDLKKIIEKEKAENKIKKVKIVANLPYYITTPIIMKLLEDELPLESITVMIQKEVADRLTAIPGEKQSGAITYSVYYYAEAIKVLEVSNDCFIPSPEVISEVIKLNIRKKPPVNTNNKQLMFRIIKYAFMQRRKTLLNSLVNSNIFKNKEEGIEVLKKLDLDLNIRPENLRLEDYASITELIL